MEEIDVKSSIKRDEFERLSSGLLERVGIPCKKALHDAGVSVGKIHSVELVGSGSRIPAIAKLLTSLFGREPSRTINASECVARGCALQCAMLSPVFRVREYDVQDLSPFSIGFSSDEGPILMPSSNGILFPRGLSIPSIKVLTFQRCSQFHLDASYADPNELPAGVSSRICSFTIGPFQSPNGDKARVKVKVQLNLHGIVTVESATVVSGDADDAGMQSPSSDASADSSTRDRGNRRIQIPVSETVYGGMTKAQLSEAHEKELELTQQDRTVEQAKEKKNALESYVYEMRNKLFNTLGGFATNVEREGISRSLQETEEWLYGDGDDETENAYTSKMQDLKRIMDECNKAEHWVRTGMQQQESMPKDIDPVLWSRDIKKRTEDLNTIWKHILRKRASPANSGDSKG
ncbi:Heat shock 70 kDa protein 16 [Linum perenne]